MFPTDKSYFSSLFFSFFSPFISLLIIAGDGERGREYETDGVSDNRRFVKYLK